MLSVFVTFCFLEMERKEEKVRYWICKHIKTTDNDYLLFIVVFILLSFSRLDDTHSLKKLSCASRSVFKDYLQGTLRIYGPEGSRRLTDQLQREIHLVVERSISCANTHKRASVQKKNLTIEKADASKFTPVLIRILFVISRLDKRHEACEQETTLFTVHLFYHGM